ncbi:alcohol dehydrogenase [Ignatzschineria ureiclastica]|uniref:Alcohol dehydrogenase n=1 Tax=Ignatzschineria ureiclastica TaxID=472582 RepID=A0A2U2AFT9_9GAMM|nr:cytochrome c [Ignatzschineria ureiclastica]PWD81523.1 alcohol dehydrogenase [Ignatzschineria ureiclastica]GHA01330.1 cytochrome c [Ignatzschineria ureiclastica]
MKKIISWLIAICVIGFIAVYAGAALVVKSRKAPEPDNATAITYNDELIARGEYIARLSDCAACHTVPGDAEYSGGLAMQTPFGAIYSTNITPDAETGIGNYSLTEFINAVKHGVRKDDSPLYPAMPYTSYTIMPDEDMEALYAYFMEAVPAVKKPNAPTTFPWIVSMRWPVAYWQLLFSPIRDFTPNPALSDIENHGAYIVEGPGHCGACHTPRGLAYEEKALSNNSDLYLSGAVIDGWRAKSLRGEAQGLKLWDEAEIVEFLKTGRTNKVIAFGAMADVVQHSSQYWSDQDLNATAAYLKQLSPAPNKMLELPKKEDTTTDLLLSGEYSDPGAILYVEHCYACHRADGDGVPRIFPALNLNSAVLANNAQSVIQVTLEGGKMPDTPADRMAFTMPAFNHLSDDEVATIINFIRNSWNNTAPEIKAEEVAEIREFLRNKAPNITLN